MKLKSTTQLPIKKEGNIQIKLKMSSLTQKANDQEKFEDEILNINIKKPKNAFNIFVAEIRQKNKQTGQITNYISKYAEQYQKLSNLDLKKYEDLAEKDKLRYKEHMNLVKKYLLDKPLKENATTYSIFVDEKLREAREGNEENDPKTVRKEARLKWDSMSSEEKSAYELKKEQHLKLYKDLKRSNKRVSAYWLYVQDLSKKPDNKGKRVAEYGEKWKNEKVEIKEKYAVYAEEVANERENNKKLYMLAYGIKPKHPKKAFKIFLAEMIKKGKVDAPFYDKGKELWYKLDENEKEIYLKKAQKEKLAYELIRREYEANNRLEKGLTAYNLFIRDLKGVDKSEFSQTGFFNYCYKKWKVLDPIIREKYKKSSNELKNTIERMYNQKMKVEKIQPPKRPLSMYNIYVKEKLPELKRKFPDLNQTERFEILGKEFPKISEKEKKLYSEKADKFKIEYEKLKKEFDLEISRLEEMDFDKTLDISINKKTKRKNIKTNEIEDNSKKTVTKEPKKDKNNKDDKGRSKTIVKKSKDYNRKRNASEYKYLDKSKDSEDEETEAKSKSRKKSKVNKNNKGNLKRNVYSDSEDDSYFDSEEEEIQKKWLNAKKGKSTKKERIVDEIIHVKKGKKVVGK